MSKKVLVLGATGAMGVYLVSRLAELGYQVDAVSLDRVTSQNPQVRYITANAMDPVFLKETLKNHYDAVVDFLIYPEPRVYAESYSGLFLENTEHYIFLSSYRVYAGSPVITETSPRLLDISLPAKFQKSLEYSIYKAEEEDIIRVSDRQNWTILRPAITYSKRRFQLVTLEAQNFLRRMAQGKKIVLPKSAMDCQATMSWAGDVARMIAALVLNPKAMGKAFTVSTSEHRSWREIAGYYREMGGLEYEEVDDETYLRIRMPGSVYAAQQLWYDRCFNRVVDNRKVLEATGMKQDELTSIKDGLVREFSRLNPADYPEDTEGTAERMEEYFAGQKTAE